MNLIFITGNIMNNTWTDVFSTVPDTLVIYELVP